MIPIRVPLDISYNIPLIKTLDLRLYLSASLTSLFSRNVTILVSFPPFLQDKRPSAEAKKREGSEQLWTHPRIKIAAENKTGWMLCIHCRPFHVGSELPTLLTDDQATQKELRSNRFVKRAQIPSLITRILF